MMTRAAKILLLGGVAVYYALVVFNNLTDFNTNYAFVQHVLQMDSTFPGNHELWRAISAPWVHMLFYLSIIAWEIVTTILLAWGAMRLVLFRDASAADFDRAKSIAVLGLTLSLLMWLVAFLSVGGEWFLMWESRVWNGEEAAFHRFIAIFLVLLFVVQPERETQP
jgi:predicted small integral membrane protein